MQTETGAPHPARVIAPAQEIIAAAARGEMVILVDGEDRENEGDLIIPAVKATAKAINFMARHGRGLICLALEPARVDALNLPLMAQDNASRYETAFTVSIEAREGVTTGISAADRARTIAVAIDPACGPADIATPGHVFPLRAREGGVLMRAGHTEAAVDIARLAGLTPAGVICEIMNEDGTMARVPDLIEFARRHGLLIGTIADLISYRRSHDNLVLETGRRRIQSFIGGDWELVVFHDTPGGAEHIALIKGDITTDRPVLTRMHVLDPLEDLLALTPERWNQVPNSMAEIAAEGRGVLVLLRDGTPSAISAAMMRERSGGVMRQYGVGAQILANLSVHEIILLTNSAVPDPVALDVYDLRILSTRPIRRRYEDPRRAKVSAPTETA